MIRLITIVGARPQFIKAAAISRAIRDYFPTVLEEKIIHTGQHYDDNLSKVFFEEMEIPYPTYILQSGSGSHAKQTATMMTGIEDILISEQPDYVVIYGDTNSTLAGAITAAKLKIPIVHIEAGLRSFNKAMPEEINRICSDHVSTLLFTPTKIGYNNLIAEGFKANNAGPYSPDNPKIYHCGDVMYDNALYFKQTALKKSKILKKYGVEENNFVLATIHRDANTDNVERLNNICKTLIEVADNYYKIVFPMHPRTEKAIFNNLDEDVHHAFVNNKNILLLPPVSFLDMIRLESAARFIITDSGGVQKEAYFFEKPSIVLRKETEWVEIVENNAAILADDNKELIIEAVSNMPKPKFTPIFGDGNAAHFICSKIVEAKHQ